ncbi:hypothetical protein LTV02_39055 [Nocardia yamanashiensis]|uniref:hypothetical protein n=1 Tax=Nocardia yamanashiensis TaxID=209247 RepID=UPI001E3CCDF2|nr:hypothetical protein [Nocardia yamanashiensis]UGT41834.1 hypothetical protein LTV02_39055 [Nocardia yamanashiensis]
MKKAVLLSVLLALPLLNACAFPLPKQKSDAPACLAEWDLRNSGEPLGSGALLLEELQKATSSANPQGTPFVEIAHKAGWSDGWDRMVDVYEDIKESDLNMTAQTEGYCWRNVPTDAGSNFAPTGFYLFVKDQKPVQAIEWRVQHNPVNLRPGQAATPQSVMIVKGSFLVPQP